MAQLRPHLSNVSEQYGAVNPIDQARVGAANDLSGLFLVNEAGRLAAMMFPDVLNKLQGKPATLDVLTFPRKISRNNFDKST